MSPSAIAEQKGILIIGIGSSHGDDRIGWSVIERLEEYFSFSHNCFGRQIVLRKAAAPHEILDWLGIELAVHIIDAVQGQSQLMERYRIERGPDGTLQCRGHKSFAVSSAVSPSESVSASNALPNVFETLSSKSSHQLDLVNTLELASVLGRTPSQLFLWTIAAEATSGRFMCTPTTDTRVHECALQIATHINVNTNAAVRIIP